jgi:ATP adenylyltransferase
MEYIQNHRKDNACVFCVAASKPNSAENLIISRGVTAFIILNRFPYTSGHIMVVPFAHEPSLERLTPQTRAELMELSVQVIEALKAEYHPHGFNLGMNIGETAGAGILDHVHLHIVPRWGGDTNFMTTLGNTRVLPESLETTYERLRKYWKENIADSS